MSRRQRDLLVDKLPDTANIVLGGMVFGQVAAGETFSLWQAILGLLLWAAIMGWALVLSGSRR